MLKSKFIVGLSVCLFVWSSYLNASACACDDDATALPVSGQEKLDLLRRLVEKNPGFNNYTPHQEIEELLKKDRAFLRTLPDDYRTNWREIYTELCDAVPPLTGPTIQNSLAYYYMQHFIWVHILASVSGEEARAAWQKVLIEFNDIGKCVRTSDLPTFSGILCLIGLPDGLKKSSSLIMPVLSKTGAIAITERNDSVGIVVGDRAFNVVLLGIGTNEKQNCDFGRNLTALSRHFSDFQFSAIGKYRCYLGVDKSDDHRDHHAIKNQVRSISNKDDLAKAELGLLVFHDSLAAIIRTSRPRNDIFFKEDIQFHLKHFVKSTFKEIKDSNIIKFQSYIYAAEEYLGIELPMALEEDLKNVTFLSEEIRVSVLASEEKLSTLKKYITLHKIVCEGLHPIADAFDAQILRSRDYRMKEMLIEIESDI